MFKNIYVDKYKNTFKIWNTEDKVIESKFQCRSWVENPGIDSPYKTIYGVPVMPVFKNYKDEYLDRTDGNLRHEIDIQPEIRILSEFYEKEKDLDFDISDFNIMSFDIETEIGCGFPEPSEAKMKVNLISCYCTKQQKYMIFGLHPIDDQRFHKLIIEKNKIYQEQFPDINITDNYSYVCAYEDETKLLNDFFTYVAKSRPDIYTGWNCIAKNSSLWLQDRIIEIKDSSSGDNTFIDGNIIKTANTGFKKAYKIETVNGYSITSSGEHIFPIKYIKEGKYYNNVSKSLLNKDCKVSELIDLSKENRLFLKVDIRNNTNKKYTYRDLLIYALISGRNSKLDILIPEPIYTKNRKKLNANYSYNKAKQYPFKFSVNNCRKLVNISDSELIDSINSIDEAVVLIDKSNATINLNEIIPDDIFKLMGLIYTDGSYCSKHKEFSFYNTDEQILDWVLNCLHSNKLSNTNSLSNGHFCKRIRCTNSAKNNLIKTLIYNEDKKDIDLSNLSRIAYSQFCAMFSGLIDGDGWISKKNSAIGFCNYNNNDINKIAELLQWNGVLCGVHKNKIHISNKSVNTKFINSLSLVGKKRDLISNINLVDNKNTKSKLLDYIFYENYYYVKIDSITAVDSVEMVDIETESHYFNTNYGIKTHNCNAFDLPYLVNRAKNLGMYEYLLLSPVKKVYLRKVHNEEYNTEELIPVISGVSCIDYLTLYKHFNKGSQKESWKLDFIANEELDGLGKVKLGDTGLNLAKKDWTAFSLYNLVDTVLITLLEPRLQMIETLIGTCSEARIPLEFFFTPKKVTLGFMLTYMHRKGLVIPFTKPAVKEKYDGAYIKMNPGPYRNVSSLDAKSMYPSIMISCNISPETKVISDKPIPGYSRSIIPNVYYNNEKRGIIPEIVAYLVDTRDEYKKQQKIYSNPERPEYNKAKSSYFKRKQNAYKIFANSIYGLLGNNNFQFYDLDNAATITGIGNRLIQYVITYLNVWIDNKLETNKDYFNEFGEFANVKIKGELSDAYINSIQDNEQKAGLGKYTRLALAHTDSFFFDYSDLYEPFENKIRSYEEYAAIKERFSNKNSPSFNIPLKKYFEDMHDEHWEKMTFTEFMLRFNYCIFQKIINKITQRWCETYSYREDRMYFKLEKCCSNVVALSKAHYICYLQYDEGDLLIRQPFKKRLKAVGVEMIKADTPSWSKTKILETLEFTFTKDNKQEVSKFIGMLKKEYKDPANISKISRPVSINSLGPTKANSFPAPRLGAIKWNAILSEDNNFSNYEQISEGTKVKWIAVKLPNKFNIQAISYNSDTWPVELNRYFRIDYETQFYKTFRHPLEKIMECYGWGNVFDGNVDSIRRFFAPK